MKETGFDKKYDFIKIEYKFECKNNKNKVPYAVCKCKKCGYVKTARTSKFFNFDNCINCIGKYYDTESFKKKVYELVGDEYTVLGKYINSETPILMKHNCKECNNYTNKIRPDNFLRTDKPVRCKICSEKRGIELSTNSIREKAKELFYENYKNLIVNSNDFEILSEYIPKRNGKETLLKLKCKKCNSEFTRLPSSIIKAKVIRCDNCDNLKSKPIIRILNFLDNHNLNYEEECSFPNFKSIGKYGNLLKYDILVKDLNLLIEYDGEQHFEMNNTYHNYDLEFYDKLKNMKILITPKYSLLRISKKEVNIIEEILNEVLLENSTNLIEKNKLLFINHKDNKEILYNYNSYYTYRGLIDYKFDMLKVCKYNLLDEDIVSAT